MIDYSDSFLAIDRALRQAYELMLKGQKDSAATVLDTIAQTATSTSAWIKSHDNH